MNVIDTINSHRLARKISITEMAFLCKVSRQYMSLVLNKKIEKPSYDLIDRAVKVLGFELALIVPIIRE